MSESSKNCGEKSRGGDEDLLQFGEEVKPEIRWVGEGLTKGTWR